MLGLNVRITLTIPAVSDLLKTKTSRLKHEESGLDTDNVLLFYFSSLLISFYFYLTIFHNVERVNQYTYSTLH